VTTAVGLQVTVAVSGPAADVETQLLVVPLLLAEPVNVCVVQPGALDVLLLLVVVVDAVVVVVVVVDVVVEDEELDVPADVVLLVEVVSAQLHG
jgi:hypothetical protein